MSLFELSWKRVRVSDNLKMVYSTSCLRQVSTPGSRRGAQGRQKRCHKDAKREPRGTNGSQKIAKSKPNGTKRDQRGPQKRKNRRQGDRMGAPRLQNWTPKGPRNGKIEKVPNTEAPKVEKMKNHKKWKDSKVKMLVFHSFLNKNWLPQDYWEFKERRW